MAVRRSSQGWITVLIAGALGLVAVCLFPLISVLTHHWAAGQGTVWGRNGERRAILIAFVPYALALIALHRLEVSRRFIVGFGGLLFAAMFVVPTVGCRDLFSYLFYGRMLEHAHLNPLAVAPNQLPADRWFGLIGWHSTPSVYGPIWTYVCALVSRLTWPNWWLGALGLKAFSIAGTFAGCMLAGRLSNHDDRARSWALAACLWNPLIIFSVAGDGHVDGVIIGAVVGALVARKSGRNALTTLLLVAASLLKIYCLLFLFLHMAALLYEDRRRISHAASHALAAAGAIAVGYAPMWAGRATFAGLARVGGLFNATFPDFLREQAHDFLLVRGVHDVRADSLSAVLARCASVVVLFALISIVLVRHRSNLAGSRTWSFAFASYLLVATYFLPWHALPLVVLALAGDPVGRPMTGLAIGALALSATSLIGVPAIRFGIPLVVAFIVSRRIGMRARLRGPVLAPAG